jgi:hypothetical protein
METICSGIPILIPPDYVDKYFLQNQRGNLTPALIYTPYRLLSIHLWIPSMLLLPGIFAPGIKGIINNKTLCQQFMVILKIMRKPD